MNALHQKPEPVKKYHGVSWHKGHKQWIAKLKSYNKYVTLGYFDDPERAARIYDCASRILRGPDAKLNFDGLPPSDMTTADVRDMLIRRGILRTR